MRRIQTLRAWDYLEWLCTVYVFCLKIEHEETFDITVHADENIDAFESYPISLPSKIVTDWRNTIEKKAFNSLNSLFK